MFDRSLSLSLFFFFFGKNKDKQVKTVCAHDEWAEQV